MKVDKGMLIGAAAAIGGLYLIHELSKSRNKSSNAVGSLVFGRRSKCTHECMDDVDCDPVHYMGKCTRVEGCGTCFYNWSGNYVSNKRTHQAKSYKARS